MKFKDLEIPQAAALLSKAVLLAFLVLSPFLVSFTALQRLQIDPAMALLGCMILSYAVMASLLFKVEQAEVGDTAAASWVSYAALGRAVADADFKGDSKDAHLGRCAMLSMLAKEIHQSSLLATYTAAYRAETLKLEATK